MKLRQIRRAKARVRPPRAYFVVHRAERDEEKLLPNVRADVDADSAEDTYINALAVEEARTNAQPDSAV